MSLISNILPADPIAHPLTLTGNQVILAPLEARHFDEICDLAGSASAIWDFSPTGVRGTDRDKFTGFLNKSLVKRGEGEWYPFVIVLCRSGRIIGCTMYHTINYQHRNLEIGCSWLHPDYWGTGINTECKYLLLKHCFEVLGLMRVQIKTSHHNLRSRKAIEKIGGRFEGILRKDKILEDGTIRNAAYYSIIDEEWGAVRQKLQAMPGITDLTI